MPKRRLSRKWVIEAALALAEEKGPEALGIRALAASLGTDPMALYRYIIDKADLEAAAADALLFKLPACPGGCGSSNCWRISTL